MKTILFVSTLVVAALSCATSLQAQTSTQAPNGQTVVFAQKEPEVFTPRAVRAEAFDSQSVLITGGLQPGEKVLLVDDILRTGQKLADLKKLVESKGGEVVGLAVVIYQPNPACINFDPLPFYYLAKLDATYYKDAASCDLCKRGVPVDKVWV
jgi:orotate phosphoribosyltransferase